LKKFRLAVPREYNFLHVTSKLASVSRGYPLVIQLLARR
jgi:hypothetical protein